MRQRDRESMTGSDPQDELFFGSSEDDYPLDDGADGVDSGPIGAHVAGTSRLETRRQSRRRHRRGVLGVLAALLAAIVVAAVLLIGVPVYHYFRPSDYSGPGTGAVIVTVHTNDGAAQIGDTLTSHGVVASQRAFVNAAADDNRSRTIQPGSYRMRKHMSAANALTLMLKPSTRVNSAILVPEGATVFDVAKSLSSPPCTSTSPQGTVCGLGLSASSVTKALDNVKALGLPTDFTVGKSTPTSAEGFLFPATYPFDDTTSVTSALQTMVGKFTDQARTTNFTARAKALHITPYQELIIASIAQSEAKYPADMAKVVRVILNRLHAGSNLKIDATSLYGAKVQGLDPSKIVNADLKSPYNTYNHSGLPPTPISNPGAEAMNAAAHPASGNWVYYVNADRAGHLFFTSSAHAFAKAVANCRAKNLGCG